MYEFGPAHELSSDAVDTFTLGSVAAQRVCVDCEYYGQLFDKEASYCYASDRE